MFFVYQRCQKCVAGTLNYKISKFFEYTFSQIDGDFCLPLNELLPGVEGKDYSDIFTKDGYRVGFFV